MPDRAVIIGATALALVFPAAANAEADDLAKQLANPVASLISVPFQLNYDSGIGADGAGSRWVLEVQPVVPFSLNGTTNVISRTIVPVVSNNGSIGSNETGFGDVVQSFFFSPKAPTANGVIWGAGPVFLLPTATDPTLGGEKWGVGITGVALRQSGPWTVGGLANHIWSFAGNEDRADVSATFLQPFISYTSPQATTVSLNTETSYDWNGDNWSVPINVNVSQLVTIGDRPVSLGAGVRYWAESPENGPEGWGLRFVATLLFPR